MWYAFTAAADGGVVIDVSQSDYSAGVLVGIGTAGNLETVACGPGTVGLAVEGGTTYYVLAIDDQDDGGGNGGMLHISFNEAPPPPTVDIAVDPVGTFVPRTGTAELTGAYTCTNGDFIDVFGDVSQAVGRFVIRASFEFFDEGTCDGEPHAWSATVFPENGKFAGGKAMTVTFAFSCGPFECADAFTEQVVKLRGGKR